MSAVSGAGENTQHKRTCKTKPLRSAHAHSVGFPVSKGTDELADSLSPFHAKTTVAADDDTSTNRSVASAYNVPTKKASPPYLALQSDILW